MPTSTLVSTSITPRINHLCLHDRPSIYQYWENVLSTFFSLGTMIVCVLTITPLFVNVYITMSERICGKFLPILWSYLSFDLNSPTCLPHPVYATNIDFRFTRLFLVNLVLYGFDFNPYRLLVSEFVDQFIVWKVSWLKCEANCEAKYPLIVKDITPNI